jgi:hypothetical protein
VFGVRLEGPSPAVGVALDIARRSIWLIPVALVVSYGFWGLDGVWSTLYGMAIVVANFLVAAWMLAVTGRIGAGAMGAAALLGFPLRLALIMVAVLAVRNAPWVELVPLGLTLVITHLVLLGWEVRHVSSSTLAFPGLKPRPTANPYLPTADERSSAGPVTPSESSPSAP